ncbi:hypothetical protein L210DRAFT_687830 [Boletus edulis BED1]|uniref:Uncharacterized protein n=1 Tax=Boletus edulis BED1 TaxID=1328754 RepID=A0AAD4BAU8_BOLED|nr:hypothetical protein L210DRAFT_687830 [Boletus edulis BED1]
MRTERMVRNGPKDMHLLSTETLEAACSCNGTDSGTDREGCRLKRRWCEVVVTWSSVVNLNELSLTVDSWRRGESMVTVLNGPTSFGGSMPSDLLTRRLPVFGGTWAMVKVSGQYVPLSKWRLNWMPHYSTSSN